MPEYLQVGLDYVPLGSAKVWVNAKDTFTTASLAKISDPESIRQEQFEQELLRLSTHLNSRIIPIFVEWTDIGRKRMDKGCIGHSVVRGFLTVSDGAEGCVEFVHIAGRDDE